MMLTKEMLSYIAENIEDIKRIIRDLVRHSRALAP